MESFVDVSASKSNPARVQAVQWLLRLEAAPADDTLKQEFESWLQQDVAHRAAYRSAQHVWARLGKLPPGLIAAPGASDIVVPLKPRNRGRAFWVGAGALLAAACLLVVAVPVIQRHLLADHLTGVAELREVVLPDGSVAHLDAGSAIAVQYNDPERKIILLEGQVFLEVVPDQRRPFRVTAADVSVQVTGTAFSVDKLASTITVTVQSGAVEVRSPAAEEVSRLERGDRLVFDRQARTAKREQVAPSTVASWRSHRLVVHDTTVGDMVEVLGRYLPGVIVVRDESLKGQSISGVIDLAQPREALNALAESQHGKLSQITPYLSVISKR
jgi:transmembrane sensor